MSSGAAGESPKKSGMNAWSYLGLGCVLLTCFVCVVGGAVMGYAGYAAERDASVERAATLEALEHLETMAEAAGLLAGFSATQLRSLIEGVRNRAYSAGEMRELRAAAERATSDGSIDADELAAFLSESESIAIRPAYDDNLFD